MTVNKNNLNKVLAFLCHSQTYLLFSQSVLKKTIESGNKFMLISDEEISEKEYFKATEWSDSNVIIPVLFSFYHGVELLLKGLLMMADGYRLEASHKITTLLKDF